MFLPPPADINEREPLIHVAPEGGVRFRSHQTKYSPLFFGASGAQRWDAPDGSYGVLYLALDEYCAFMESIGRGVLRTRFVASGQLRSRALSKIRMKDDLRLIDLVSSGGLTLVGAEGSLTSGTGYRNSQRCSQALRAHPAKPDGIYYRSRFDPSLLAYALFDQCRLRVETRRLGRPWAEQPQLLGPILDHYRFGTDL
jgi:hypothetical protein